MFATFILDVFLICLGGLIGATIVQTIRKTQLATAAKNTEQATKDLIQAAERKEQEVLARAKDKAIKILEEARLEEKRGAEDLKNQQLKLLEHEQSFAKKILDADQAKERAEQLSQNHQEALQRTAALEEQHRVTLQQIAGLTPEQAIERFMKDIETEHQDRLIGRMRKLDEVEAEEIDRRAKNILATAVQRQAASHVAETTTTHVELATEEMKGRIIGREGRNIKALELLTGCELIVDDTPNLVTVSGFSPIRRQIAKRALEALLGDGRIHPGRIEEAVEQAKKDLIIDMRKAGEDALFQLGISMAGIDPKMVQILGRLKYRTSYGQNALIHSMEVANIGALLAEELGGNVITCKKGGLFHDIGKAVDHDMQGSHPELGYQIMKKFGFPEEVCYQSISHHEDKPKTLEGVIVKAADAVSGARPGARKDSLQAYVKRLEELEQTALRFEGVEKVYAIQAGREIRVFVNPKNVDDLAAIRLARDIANKIEAELKFPGEIRVTLIRETRVVEYAK